MDLHGITPFLLLILCSFVGRTSQSPILENFVDYMGEELSFVCYSKVMSDINDLVNNPVIFKKDGAEVAVFTKVNDDLSDRYMVKHAKGSGDRAKFTFYILNATAGDAGRYECFQGETLYEYNVELLPIPVPVDHVSFIIQNAANNKMEFKNELSYSKNMGEQQLSKALRIKAGFYKLQCEAHGGRPTADVSIFKGQEEIGKNNAEVLLTESVVDLHCRVKQTPLKREEINRKLTFSTNVISDKANVQCSNTSAFAGASQSSVTCIVTASFANCKKIHWLIGMEKLEFRHGEEGPNTKYEVSCQRDAAKDNTYVTQLKIFEVAEKHFEEIYNIVIEDPFGSSFESEVTLKQSYVGDNGAAKTIVHVAVFLPILLLLL